MKPLKALLALAVAMTATSSFAETIKSTISPCRRNDCNLFFC